MDPWVGKIPWRRKWQPTLVFLLGKSHGQRSLVGYSPWGHKRVRHDLATKLQQQKIKANHLIMEKMVNVAVKYTLLFALVYAL